MLVGSKRAFVGPFDACAFLSTLPCFRDNFLDETAVRQTLLQAELCCMNKLL